MSMVMDTQFVKGCLPFSDNTGHDKWIIACACGKISYLDEVLVS